MDRTKKLFIKYFSFKGRASRLELFSVLLFIFFSYILIVCLQGKNDFKDIIFLASAATFANVGFALDTIAIFIRSPPLSGDEKYAALWSLVTFFPMIAVTTRRLHDLNIRGLWQGVFYSVLMIIPFLHLNVHSGALMMMIYVVMLYGAMFFFFLVTKRGTIGPNRYGPDPLAVISSDSEKSRPDFSQTAFIRNDNNGEKFE